MPPNTIVLASVASIIHHFVLQYPNQADTFVTLYGFALSNAVFLVSQRHSLEFSLRQVISFSISWFLFNTVYVHSLDTADLRLF